MEILPEDAKNGSKLANRLAIFACTGIALGTVVFAAAMPIEDTVMSSSPTISGTNNPMLGMEAKMAMEAGPQRSAVSARPAVLSDVSRPKNTASIEPKVLKRHKPRPEVVAKIKTMVHPERKDVLKLTEDGKRRGTQPRSATCVADCAAPDPVVTLLLLGRQSAQTQSAQTQSEQPQSEQVESRYQSNMNLVTKSGVALIRVADTPRMALRLGQQVIGFAWGGK